MVRIGSHTMYKLLVSLRFFFKKQYWMLLEINHKTRKLSETYQLVMFTLLPVPKPINLS